MISADASDLAQYFDGARARVPAFARRHFGFLGTARLHAAALGLDLLRAPLNVLLVGPALFTRLAGFAAGRLGLARPARWLASRRLFVETRLARRIAELVLEELLEVEPKHAATPPAWAERARHLLAEYVAARHAVAELAAGAMTLVVGLATLNALTPSAISMGPALARANAQSEAMAAFWLGPWAGSLYYSWWPAQATWDETLLTTLLVLIAFALVATFMGLVTDPLQQALGLHERRLNRLLATLERAAAGEAEARLDLPDPYVARLADMADVATIALRMLR